MLFKPKWIKLLPSNLSPDGKRIGQLENFRRTFGIPHEALAMRVISSTVTTRRAQRNCFETFRARNPQASQKELLTMVLLSRIQTPPLIEITEEEIDQAIKSINSFDELCDCIIKLEEREPSFPDPLGIGKVIDEILAQEVIEKEARHGK